MRINSTIKFLSVLMISIYTSCERNASSGEQDSIISEDLEVKTLILKNRGYDRFPDIYHYKNLEYLDLSNNSIKEIPEEIIAFKKLKKLYLSENDIQVIPSHISKLDSLSLLYLLHNKVKIVSPVICSMEKLRVLNLNGNPNNNIPECLKSTSKIIVYLESNMK